MKAFYLRRKTADEIKIDALMSIDVYYQKLKRGIVVTLGDHDIKLKLSNDQRYLIWRHPFFGLKYRKIMKSKLLYCILCIY